MICERAPLAPFQTGDQKVTLKCDACDTGMGAVLEQEQPNGVMAPVLYWSSKFRQYESNYAIGEKEALACVAAVTKLRKYLIGRHFTLQTDHRALQTLLSQTKIKRTLARIERWREKLSCFDYSIEYIKGEDNNIADMLSRTASETDHKEVPLKEELVINSINVEKPSFSSNYENNLKRLAEIIKYDRWSADDRCEFAKYYKMRNHITENNGLLFYDRNRFIPAISHRNKIITEAHKIHQGITKTRFRIAEYFWWPQWTQEVEIFIKKCKECSLSDRNKLIPNTPLVPVTLPKKPWDKVALDIKGPLRGCAHKYLIVLIDYYSKWPEVIGVNTITACKIIEVLMKIFTRYGLPKELVSDNGTQFVAKETQEFLNQLGIKHRKVPLYAPQQNGLVERFNRILSERIAESKKFGWCFSRTIESVVYNYRSTPRCVTQVSPFEAFFRRKMNTSLSQLFPPNKSAENKNINRKRVNNKLTQIKSHIDEKRSARKRNFRVGQKVLLRDQNKKLGTPKIIQKVMKSSIQTSDGKVWPMNRAWIFENDIP